MPESLYGSLVPTGNSTPYSNNAKCSNIPTAISDHTFSKSQVLVKMSNMSENILCTCCCKENLFSFTERSTKKNIGLPIFT